MLQRTIAGDHQELVIIREVVHHDVGVCGHDLLLGSKLGALLELEVADRSRQGQVAVHPSEVDKATSGGDSCLLAWEPKKQGSETHVRSWRSTLGSQESSTPSFWGLWSKDSGFARPLTPRTLLESPALACCASQVSSGMSRKEAWQGSTYNVDFVVGKETNAGCAARNLLLVFGICSRKAKKHLSAHVRACRERRSSQDSRTVEYCAVGGEEAVLQRLLIVARLERILLCDDVVNVLACEKGNLVAAMTVEDTEKGEPLGVVLGGIGVGGEKV